MKGLTTPAPIITPEAIALDLDIAGAGSRFIAAFIDSAIIFGFGIAEALGGGLLVGLGIPSEPVLIGGLVLWVLINLLYYPILEGLWDGRTVGKKRERIRVVHSDGTPITWQAAAVRNLIRPIEVPLGLAVMILTRRSQRLGDLAAGTIVVHEHSAPAPDSIAIKEDSTHERFVLSTDTTLLSEKDYAIVRSFLARRGSLDPDARKGLAQEIAMLIASKTGVSLANLEPEIFLEAIHVSRRPGPRAGSSAASSRPLF